MAQIYGPGANLAARTVLISIVAVPVGLAVLGGIIERSGWMTGKDFILEQPVPFSHQHHAGQLGLDCRYCHTSVETSQFAGLPPTETCMTCHSQLWTQSAMLAPVRESLAHLQPLAWQRVYALPDYVYFDHSVHVRNGIGCSSCHGAVDTMPLINQATPMTMSFCLDCHRSPSAKLRPPTEIFDMHWQPPPDQHERGQQLLAQYHIDPRHLTECSVCHR